MKDERARVHPGVEAGSFDAPGRMIHRLLRMDVEPDDLAVPKILEEVQTGFDPRTPTTPIIV